MGRSWNEASSLQQRSCSTDRNRNKSKRCSDVSEHANAVTKKARASIGWGDVITTVGLVLEGGVRIESVDVWGNVSVLGVKDAGGMFDEAYAAIPDEPLMVDVIAAEDTTVLFLNLAKVLATCSHACPHHSRTSTNMTAIIARQSLSLSRRILHVAPKTIRGKTLAYLSDIAERTGKREFDIPFDRQQLADYLGVDRSALSAELSRMQKAGLIETRRSHFVLK